MGICLRLIDDFLQTKPSVESLTIIFTTRSERKSSDTLRTLQNHLAKQPRQAQQRVHFQPESVELTNLLSVRDLARKLTTSDVPHLNAVILNAGIGGWTGLNWPKCIWACLTDIRRATVWPEYKLGAVGLITKPQLPPLRDGSRIDEPPLAEVFCANVFGHYMLAHRLMPLLWSCSSETPGKIMWVGSVEARKRHYNPEDHQGLQSDCAYEHGKRLSDYLALTSRDQPATRKYISAFLGNSNGRRKGVQPSIEIVHPGIVTTTIISLYWIMQQGYLLGIYIARWLGSPWSTVHPYPAARSATWLTFASVDEVSAKLAEEGGDSSNHSIKWGTCVDRSGHPSVRMTDVEGWGVDGSGNDFASRWWGGSSWWGGGQLGRFKGAVDATRENVEAFVDEGAEAWRKMEELREDWEKRLDEYDRRAQALN